MKLLQSTDHNGSLAVNVYFTYFVSRRVMTLISADDFVSTTIHNSMSTTLGMECWQHIYCSSFVVQGQIKIQ